MKLDNIGNTLNNLTGRTGLLLKKNSPEILMTVGIAGLVCSTVLACKATLKAEGVINRHKDSVDKISEVWDKVEVGEISVEDYNETDRRKDLVMTYSSTSVEFLKLYGPAIGLGIASIGCIIGSHNVMKRRNVALMAAYKAVDEAFKNYRQRVVEEHGEHTDYLYKNGLRAEVITETEIGEDGKKRKVDKMKIVDDADPNRLSQYARFFDEGCSQWSKTPEYNMMFLRAQQNYYNDMLKARGHVFLNEVYDALGITRSKAGAVVGWVLSKDSDNYIDFGIFDGTSRAARAFVNGDERSILLDFNVDGVIYDLI
jgi:hypothetical protein